MNGIQLIIFCVVIIGIMIVPTVLSNKKRKKKQEEMINSFKAGVKVVTIGGIKGEIVNVLTDSVEIKVDKSVRLTVLKTAISEIIK